MNTSKSKLKIAILGSGNIGTDLLVKVMRSKFLECTVFIGRNLNSSGMQKALELGVNVSSDSIDYIVKNPDCCDLVFDATSASSHIEHEPILKSLNKRIIDLTPAKLGLMCVPSVNLNDSLSEFNVNMITCEWDTAAAQAVLEGVGGYVCDLKGNRLLYGKREALNPSFISGAVPFSSWVFQ